MTGKSFALTSLAVLSAAVAVLAVLGRQKQQTRLQRSVAWTPSYRMLCAAESAGVLRN